MYLLKRASVLASSIIFSASLLATPIDSQRQQFLTALEAANSGRHEQVERAIPSLNNYPLLPYVKYAQAIGRLNQLSPEEVNQLLTTLEGTPLYQRFLSAYSISLSEQRRWLEFFNYFSRVRNPSPQLQCMAARGELNRGYSNKAFEEGVGLWTIGRSQHAACDPLFSRMIDNGQISSATALERALLALENNNVSIAKYAERFITQPSDQQQMALIWQLYNQPSLLRDNPSIIRSNTPNKNRLATLAIERLATSDLRQALLTWSTLNRNLELSTSEQAPTVNRLGVLFAKRFQPDAESVLAHVDPNFDFSDITEWRIRLALTQQDWSRVSSLIKQLPEDLQSDGRWLYWSIIADMQQGRQPSPDKLNKLSTERSYYGFKAAELTQRPFSINNRPSNFTAAQKEQVANLPVMLRMYELYRLGQTREATQEWNFMTSMLSPEQLHIASHIVQSWGWYFQGIRGAIASDQWDDLALRFPAPYRHLFDQASREFNIEPSWALAVTRQESAFLDVARSGAGARGLMQLMPATARETARRANIPLSSLDRLNEPDINVRLGSAYLAQMQQQFGNNRVHATAAYNAGPGRVRQWLSARGHLPLDIWIETIPFDETRGYVLNVLAFGVIYNTMAGQPARVFSEYERAQLAWSSANR